MRTFLVSVLFILSITGCDCGGNILKEYKKYRELCGQPCYPENINQYADVGACHMGTYVCDDVAEIALCEDYVLPSSEVCDGIDNDCNGQTDMQTQGCSNSCGSGRQTCIDGYWGACDAPQPRPEECNGLDDDCDGVTDNEDRIPVEFCYDGDRQTMGRGICHPGFTSCVEGNIVCQNQQLPEMEVCDSIDNNCNGVIDEGFGNGDRVDVIFVADNSGSMLDYVDKVRYIADEMAREFRGNAVFSFALVTAPDSNGSFGPQPHLYMNFSTVDDLRAALYLQGGSSPFSEEYTLDAIADICDMNNPLQLNYINFSQEKKFIVMLSDEDPQSENNRTRITDIPGILGRCNARLITLTVSQAWVPVSYKFFDISRVSSTNISNYITGEVSQLACMN